MSGCSSCRLRSVSRSSAIRFSLQSCTFVGRNSKSSSPSDSSSPTASLTVTVSLQRSSSSSSQPNTDSPDRARPPDGLCSRSMPAAASRPMFARRELRIVPVGRPSSATLTPSSIAAPRKSLMELDRKRDAAPGCRDRLSSLWTTLDLGVASSADSGTGSHCNAECGTVVDD